MRTVIVSRKHRAAPSFHDSHGGLIGMQTLRAFMSFVLLVLFAVLCASPPAMAQTQSQLNDDACTAYKQADKKLNLVYQQVIARHKGDAVFITKFKNAQRAWLAFRDAELDAIYPAPDKQVEYGSIYSMCHCTEQAALVDQRIQQLSAWLKPKEGDVCGGSR